MSRTDWRKAPGLGCDPDLEEEEKRELVDGSIGDDGEDDKGWFLDPDEAESSLLRAFCMLSCYYGEVDAGEMMRGGGWDKLDQRTRRQHRHSFERRLQRRKPESATKEIAEAY